MKAHWEESLLALASLVFLSGLIYSPRRDHAILTFCDLPLILTEGRSGVTCYQVLSLEKPL